jgi:hypothetical protein
MGIYPMQQFIYQQSSGSILKDPGVMKLFGSISTFVIIAILLSTLPMAAGASEPAGSADKPLVLLQKKGNVRVTLLGVSSGVSFHRMKSGVPEGFGETPYRYLQALFLVEQSGPAAGSNGGIEVFGPGGKLDFGGEITAVTNYEFFKEMKKPVLTPADVPGLSDDTLEAYVYQNRWHVTSHGLPSKLVITARFFGEDFSFFNILLP